MSTEIFMPALSPTMTEGTLSKWLVKVGDKIKAGDIVAEIETDKATMEIEAVDEGIITNLLIKEGKSGIAVNSVIAILNGNEKSYTKEDSKTEETLKKSESVKDKNDIQISDETIEPSKKLKTNKNIFVSPYARNLANEKNISLDNIKGSGPQGRIIKRDLLNEKDNKQNLDFNDSKIAPSTIRKIIAERTTHTKQNVPHFYLSIESNADKIIELRKKINEKMDFKISINDILVKCLAYAQEINPKTNVSWSDGKITKHPSIDVSIAVALEEGLVTPIIKNANKKGIKEISIEIKQLVEKAKKGKLLPDEYNGGTISISNLGMYGITEFSAIINPPQSCILAIGSIRKKPYVINEEIKAVNTLISTLSADHRVLDGAVAGKLLKDFNDIIENPFKLWLMSKDMEII